MRRNKAQHLSSTPPAGYQDHDLWRGIYIVIASLIVVQAGQAMVLAMPPHPELDPPPSHKPSPTPGAPPIVGRGDSWEKELSDFAEGKATHAKSLAFCLNRAQEIQNYVAQGRRVERIVVTGFADGIPNRGLKLDPASLPYDCAQDIRQPIDDVELAVLRGCILRRQLLHVLGSRYPGGIRWEERDPYDEPDGGRQGGAYRKVVVQFFLRSKK